MSDDAEESGKTIPPARAAAAGKGPSGGQAATEADRWAKAHPALKGDEAIAAVKDQSWDDSVKALVPFPSVLTMMSEKLDWTQKLGDAFLAQPDDVMDSVQRLRGRAQQAGNLKSNEQITVSTQAPEAAPPASPQGKALRDAHEKRQSDAEHRENDVEPHVKH